ncbi:Probable ubiquitin-conjugating enzyme E2 25 [Striga hermonthica]|uniref:E2 ubiquitin-conjugating enzyme n=1 Tax=Striga hermonthica TaxID=68872 RepID=A0A9N7R2S0_STRHE|nr:Probable ubiquitin-conjugating enzyme E2 25 [Striga hermonthica]
MKGVMKSPPPAQGFRYNLRSLKKRVFPGGSSSARGLKQLKLSAAAPSGKAISAPAEQNEIDGQADTKGKGKEIMEILDVDNQSGGPLDDEKANGVNFKKFDTIEDCSDHHYAESNSSTEKIDEQADIKGKGKEIMEISDVDNQNDGPSDEKKANIVNFKKFDTVEDCSDHHYASSNSSTKTVNQKWAKRIQEEWKILEEHLPDAIFVRVYESRMDLLRAVIVGAKGTPYHDGLFFFDLHLPGNYPDAPPKVYYYSGGLRLNPNLYESGYVCLSLLNTWSGRGNELWMKGSSTLLQVLVSIQGLVLNTEPYFNEPGYSSSKGTKHGDEGSLRYSETAFIYSLKTMVYSMNKPPMHFEPLVVEHFVGRAREIMSLCVAYSNGARVGSLVEGGDGHQEASKANVGCSDHFKNNLRGFVKTLLNPRASDLPLGLQLPFGFSGARIEASRTFVPNYDYDNMVDEDIDEEDSDEDDDDVDDAEAQDYSGSDLDDEDDDGDHPRRRR